MQTSSQYIYLCAQPGTEDAVKREMARNCPDFRFAFSRAGFLTFKVAEEKPILPGFDLKSTFARCYGFSIGRVEGEEAGAMARMAIRLASERKYQQLHIWRRESAALVDQPLEVNSGDPIADVLLEEAKSAGVVSANICVNRRARADDLVLDIIIIDEGLWWVGWHKATSHVLRQPGGLFPVTLPEHAVSRAYVKMNEALMWSQMPLQKGDNCVEIGSAPGGSCQALLERNLRVTGIDPSEMSPVVLSSPNFVHIKKRGGDLKRSEYQSFKWLMVDSNVIPQKTLDLVETIVKYSSVRLDGMLLTLKLSDLILAEQIPEHLERIRSWGYKYVRARQLRNNRQEYCVAVLRSRTLSRLRHRGKRGPVAGKKKAE